MCFTDDMYMYMYSFSLNSFRDYVILSMIFYARGITEGLGLYKIIAFAFYCIVFFGKGIVTAFGKSEGRISL